MKSNSKEQYPHSEFPVKLIHKDGKELKDTKTCYFQSIAHAQKYIQRCNFKKKDYKLTCKEDEQ